EKVLIGVPSFLSTTTNAFLSNFTLASISFILPSTCKSSVAFVNVSLKLSVWKGRRSRTGLGAGEGSDGGKGACVDGCRTLVLSLIITGAIVSAASLTGLEST